MKTSGVFTSLVIFLSLDFTGPLLVARHLFSGLLKVFLEAKRPAALRLSGTLSGGAILALLYSTARSATLAPPSVLVSGSRRTDMDFLRPSSGLLTGV